MKIGNSKLDRIGCPQGNFLQFFKEREIQLIVVFYISHSTVLGLAANS